MRLLVIPLVVIASVGWGQKDAIVYAQSLPPGASSQDTPTNEHAIDAGENPSTRELPPELIQEREWTPKPGKGVRTTATFLRFDREEQMVFFHVRPKAVSRGRGAARSRTPNIQTVGVPLNDLVERDQKLILDAFPGAPTDDSLPASDSRAGSTGANVAPANEVTSTDYWQAVLRLREMVQRLEELEDQHMIEYLAELSFKDDARTGAQTVANRLRYYTEERERYSHIALVKALQLRSVGWSPDAVDRELRNRRFDERIRREMKDASGVRLGVLRNNVCGGGKSDQAHLVYDDTERCWRHGLAARALMRRYERWTRGVTAFQKQPGITDEEQRLRKSYEHRDKKRATEDEAKKLQREWSDLMQQYSGFPTFDKERNRPPFITGLENHCLKESKLGQATIQLSTPKWTSLSLAFSGGSTGSEAFRRDDHYPIAAIVAVLPPEAKVPGKGNGLLGEIKLLPTEEHWTPPSYAKDWDGLSGGKYAYFDRGIKVWYGPIEVTLADSDTGIDGFPYGDEQAQLELLRNTLDLARLVEVLGLSRPSASESRDSDAVTKPSPKSIELASNDLYQQRTWTNSQGKTATARLKSFDRDAGLVLLILPNREQPYAMKFSDLSEEDQELLSAAFGGLER